MQKPSAIPANPHRLVAARHADGVVRHDRIVALRRFPETVALISAMLDVRVCRASRIARSVAVL